MQNVESILIKFIDKPGICNLSELRKLKSFLSGLRKNTIKFERSAGTESTTTNIDQIIDDVTLCYEMHENYDASNHYEAK